VRELRTDCYKKRITIELKNVNDLKGWFSEYMQTFIDGDEDCKRNVLLKADHTERVCREIVELGKALELNPQDIYLAEIMALFHDVGRFEQYIRYRTFVDRKSEDHALIGVTILQDKAVLDGFDNPTQDLILRTIQYHNRAALPQNETEQCLFFSKLLRDADKLDIWKVVTDYYHRENRRRNAAIELGLPDTPGVSEFVYQDIMKQQIVNADHIRNLNDFKVLQMGWIFDINFKPTFRAVQSRGYIEMIQDALPVSIQIQDIAEKVRAHLDWGLNHTKE